MLEGGGLYDSWAQTPPRIDWAISLASHIIFSKSQWEIMTFNRHGYTRHKFILPFSKSYLHSLT